MIGSKEIFAGFLENHQHIDTRHILALNGAKELLLQDTRRFKSGKWQGKVDS